MENALYLEPMPSLGIPKSEHSVDLVRLFGPGNSIEANRVSTQLATSEIFRYATPRPGSILVAGLRPQSAEYLNLLIDTSVSQLR